jgi:hypothetical protein
MTLNVNLEDVPFAILEAVRGRIMSNRRRLQENQEQQQQRPALQHKPQFRKFGADGRTWKRPEPAAVPVSAGVIKVEELIVYWTETGPAATAGNITWTAQDFGSEYATTTFQGQLAAKAMPAGTGAGTLHEGLIDESIFSIGTGDFTFEAWLRPGSTTSSTISSAEYALVSMGAVAGGAELQLTGNSYLPELDESPEWVEQITFRENEPSITNQRFALIGYPGWTHVSLQRQSDLIIYHRAGERVLFNIKNDELSNDQTANIFNMSGNLTIQAFPHATVSTDTAVGQIRITRKRARYGTSNFTPPTTPFYVAPTP